MLLVCSQVIRHGGGYRRRRSGSVIVLVVAVLALLAVIGTVYIVSARAQRSTATASSVAANLDFGQKAVNEEALKAIGSAMYDANGLYGGYSSAGTLGTHMARGYDMPEGSPPAAWGVATGIAPNNVANGAFSAIDNQYMQDESWLADGIYRYNDNNTNGLVLDPSTNRFPTAFKLPQPDVRYNSTSILTTGAYDPATGRYDIPYFQNGTGNFAPNFSSITGGGMFSVVRNPAQSVNLVIPTSPTFPPPGGTIISAVADSPIGLLPFSEESGIRYRVGVRIVDTSAMANLNVGLAYDPTSRNTGLWGGGSPLLMGTYVDGYDLAAQSIFPWAPVNSAPAQGMYDAFNAMRNGQALGINTPAGWEKLLYSSDAVPQNPPASLFDLSDELELRSYGAVGTSVLPRPATVALAALVPNPVAPSWGYTLGGAAMNGAFPNRNFYTTYSYASDIRTLPPNDLNISKAPATNFRTPNTPTNNDAYTLTPPANYAPQLYRNGVIGNVIWPPYPARISAAPLLNNLDGNLDIFDIARAATNIASAMELLPAASTPPNTVAPSAAFIGGYSHAEACAFAANYVTYSAPTWSIDATGGYLLRYGPSFVDDKGICARTSIWYHNKDVSSIIDYGNGVASDLHADLGNLYLGYAAQPFLNEVALFVAADINGNPSYDSAIELYNPYDVPLSLADFAIQIDSNNLIPLKGIGPGFIPARGYIVISAGGGNLDGRVAAGVPKGIDPTLKLQTSQKVYLVRAYIPRDQNVKTEWAAVDEWVTRGLNSTPPLPGQNVTYFEARSNDETRDGKTSSIPSMPVPIPPPVAYDSDRRWVATVATDASMTVQTDGQNGAALSLGAVNTTDTKDFTTVFIPLHDSDMDDDHLRQMNGVGHYEQICLSNIGDFNRIMRIAHTVSTFPTGATKVHQPSGSGPVSLQLWAAYKNAGTNPNAVTSAFPADSMVHFDFTAPPLMYSNNGIPNITGAGDPRPARLLDCLAFVDRASDTSVSVPASIDIGTGNPDPTAETLAKMRIPGRINVNTAPPEVLLSIPAFSTAGTITGTDATLGSYTPHPELVAALLAYRWRTIASSNSAKCDPRIPLYLTQGLPDLDFTSVPGYGFRSMAEVLTAINAAEAQWGTFAQEGLKPVNLDERDFIWACAYNYLTVRSDTFALYGYIEAVKQNPRYTGAFNNGTDWYTNNITDDPSDPTYPLLRVARRRWVAIIDRSQMNYNVLDYDLSNVNSRLRAVYPPPPNKPSIVAQRDLPQ